MHSEKWKDAVGAERREQLWRLTHQVFDDLPTERLTDFTFLSLYGTDTRPQVLYLINRWDCARPRKPSPQRPPFIISSLCDWNVMWKKQAVLELNMGSKTQITRGWQSCGFQVFFNRPHKLDTHLALPRLLWLHGAGKPQHDNQTLVSQFLTFPFKCLRGLPGLFL